MSSITEPLEAAPLEAPPLEATPPDAVTPFAGTPTCPANIRETKIAFGFKPQASLTTKNLDAELWSLTKTNNALATLNPVTEDDSNDIGKGDEFPTQIFPTSMDASFPIEKYASSEILAWAFAFMTGNAVKSGSVGTGLTYTCSPGDPTAQCIQLPPFTYVEQIRTGANAVVDRALIGCVVADFALSMKSGPGRANCTVAINCVGTGNYLVPSGSVLPANTPEHFLNAASATLNIAGIDYVAEQSFVSLDFKYSNNVRLDTGYFPGSGTINGYAVRGRMEYNNREFSLTFVARASKGSREYTQLLAQPPTENPLTVTLKGALISGTTFHSMSITAPRTVLSAVVVGDDNGIVTVSCTVKFLKPVSGQIITCAATCVQDTVGGL